MLVRTVWFQSPEGDSGLCYEGGRRHSFWPGLVSVPRRGFRSLLLGAFGSGNPTLLSFSPPKGIQVFVTLSGMLDAARRVKFQSPEGDSGLCYLFSSLASLKDARGFSPPKGIQVFVTS